MKRQGTPSLWFSKLASLSSPAVSYDIRRRLRMVNEDIAYKIILRLVREILIHIHLTDFQPNQLLARNA